MITLLLVDYSLQCSALCDTSIPDNRPIPYHLTVLSDTVWS